MTVNTKAFGRIELDDKQKLEIPLGLFGFEDYKNFILFDAEHQPFYWLQSLDDQEIAFILINPFLFRPDYEVNLSNEDLADIGITSPEKALIFVIVTIPQDGSSLTANLQGPLVINREKMKGMQGVLSDNKWKTKHDIMAEFKESGK
ncbi:MAG: flagellar assembly protein FliW [Treponema sp.]|nr:flagellar assembly protein FliW [Treponema sp.]MCL2272330.1 flagellar assembly protein FliW [Treponema sp.]